MAFAAFKHFTPQSGQDNPCATKLLTKYKNANLFFSAVESKTTGSNVGSLADSVWGVTT
jgi:hypothetical protein